MNPVLGQDLARDVATALGVAQRYLDERHVSEADLARARYLALGALARAWSDLSDAYYRLIGLVRQEDIARAERVDRLSAEVTAELPRSPLLPGARRGDDTQVMSPVGSDGLARLVWPAPGVDPALRGGSW